MVSEPSFIINSLSQLIPLPAFPVLVSESVPPSICTLLSALMQVAPLVLTSVSSHSPVPAVLAVMVPPWISTSQSALIALAAVAVAATLMVPSTIVMVPVSSASRSVSSLNETCMPSSPTPLTLSVPLSMSRYWLQLTPSLTALSTLMVQFFISMYSLLQMPCAVLA